MLTFISGIVAYRSSAVSAFRLPSRRPSSRGPFPGLVVGIGIFYATVLLPGGGLLRGSLAILVIAYIIRYFPTGFADPLAGLPADWRGSRKSRAGHRRLADPLLCRPSPCRCCGRRCCRCFLLYFVQFFKEYAAASFLFGPDTAVIGTTMLQLNLMGNFGPVAALSVITLVLTLPVAIFIYSGKKGA